MKAKHIKLYSEVGGLRWSPSPLSGPNGLLNPDTGILYYSLGEATLESAPQGLRIPTKSEFKSFLLQTTHEWIEQEGLPGMLFTDKENGNTLFFPAVGNMLDRKELKQGFGKRACYYWLHKSPRGCYFFACGSADSIEINSAGVEFISEFKFPAMCVLR